MASGILLTFVSAMQPVLRPRAHMLAPAYCAYKSYALSRTMLSSAGISDWNDDCGILVLADNIGVAQGSSVPIFRGGPPI